MIGPSSSLRIRFNVWCRMLPVLFLATLPLLTVACMKEENTYVAPPPPEVTVKSPVVKDITQFFEFTGRTDSVERVEIRARVRGFLDAPKFKDGDVVKKDQLLYEIDPREYQAALDGADAMMQAAIAERDLAEATFNRLNEAAKKGAVSKLEAIQAEASVKVANARISTAEATQTSARLNLSYTKILSPIDGQISRTYVTEGNLVGQGETTLLTTVVRQDPLFAFFTVSERDLIQILRSRPETREYDSIAQVPEEHRATVLLRLADGTDYEHEGKITYADNTVNPETGTISVRATFPNPKTVILPGMFARVLLPRETKDAMLVPEVAVQRDLAGYFVMTVNKESEVVRVKIEPGKRHGDMRVIKGGLEAGAKVIINGLQRARPGIKVNAMAHQEEAQQEPADEETNTPTDDSDGE